MRKMKKGTKAVITGQVVIRRKNGRVEALTGNTVQVIADRKQFCLCDTGGEKPVCIPKKNLKVA